MSLRPSFSIALSGAAASGIGDRPGADMPLEHQILLGQLQKRLYRSLDPAELWTQAVEQLSQGLSPAGCLACAYELGELLLPVVACWGQPLPSLAPDLCSPGLNLDALPALTLALAQLRPVVVNLSDETGQAWSLLVAPTAHGNQPNGLLLLYRPCGLAEHHWEHAAKADDAPAGYAPAGYAPGGVAPEGVALDFAVGALGPWSLAEQALVEAVGEALGAAIAHSTLVQENRALAQKLQQVKDDFLYKHKEIEEAQRRAELAYREAEEASRLKSEFLANTSHELRTPLNGMIGFLKLVLDGMADTEEELQEFVGEAHNSALLLLDIINDILDVAKIEAGKMDLDLTAVQLNELFEDVSKKTRRQAMARKLLYEITPPKTHDEVIVYGDYQRLLQVMLNLVGNALKFTHSGSITIHSRIIEKPVLVNGEDMPGLLEIRVVDTGIGVSLDQQAKLFKSFSQVDGSRTRQYGGTGLGLVISQKLVESMGGEVHFYSMGEGLGSTVTFTVPLYQKPVMKAMADEVSHGCDDRQDDRQS